MGAKEIKIEPGTVMPYEWNWQEDFSFEGVFEPFIKMDVGKVRGLAAAYQNLLAKQKGMVLVPRIPTEEMIEEGISQGMDARVDRVDVIRIFDAMVNTRQ